MAAYTYYMTRRFSSTAELNNFLNGTELKAGTATYNTDGGSTHTLTDSAGGFGSASTDPYNGKRIVISGVSSDVSGGETNSDTVLNIGAISGKSDGDTVSYKIFSSAAIVSTDIVDLTQDHSNLWVLVYKTTTAGF